MLKLARYEKKPGFKSAFNFTFPKTIFDSFQHYLIRRIPFSFRCFFVFIVITFLFARIHPIDFPQTPVWLITQLRSTNFVASSATFCGSCKTSPADQISDVECILCLVLGENEFYLHENKQSFSYQWLCTLPRIETEAWSNSKRAYRLNK